ncbi:MAG: hypothetical protein QG596_1112 [Actinomycetota bacterium]|jgi:hypothetical protein|nr:hypothetical protein [Actinomycetota bacterium]
MGDTPIKHFLITYDIEAGQAKVRRFGENYSAALDAYTKAEDAHKNDTNLDIVLVGAENIDVIKRTHSSYFDTRDEFDSLLAGILK